jgi:hypothetical protein
LAITACLLLPKHFAAIEQGIGLFWNEDAQQAGAGVRAAEVAGGASHGGDVFPTPQYLSTH